MREGLVAEAATDVVDYLGSGLFIVVNFVNPAKKVISDNFYSVKAFPMEELKKDLFLNCVTSGVLPGS